MHQGSETSQTILMRLSKLNILKEKVINNTHGDLVTHRCVPIARRNQSSYKRQIIPVLRQDINYSNDNFNYVWLPSFYLINARSLPAKVDELQALLHCYPVEIIAITESWLHDDISDELIAVNGFKIYRNDRCHSHVGGVCIYLSVIIPCQRRYDLECSRFECIWLRLRPKRLPWPLCGIVICLICNPPLSSAQDVRDLDEYLIDSSDKLRNIYPDCGIVILGGFNNYDPKNLISTRGFNQVVHQPTRGSAILDLIVTNLHRMYEEPQMLAPLGTSDHNIMHWTPVSKDVLNSNILNSKSAKYLTRRYPRSGIDSFGRWMCSNNWFADLGVHPSVDVLVSNFSSLVTNAIDKIFPLKTVKLHPTDKP